MQRNCKLFSILATVPKVRWPGHEASPATANQRHAPWLLHLIFSDTSRSLHLASILGRARTWGSACTERLAQGSVPGPHSNPTSLHLGLRPKLCGSGPDAASCPEGLRRDYSAVT